jgi:hypothetical protein
MKYIDEVLKQFDEKFTDLRLYPDNDDIERFVTDEVKDFLEQSLIKLEKQVREEIIEKLKNGEICTSCGKEAHGKLSDWCNECLENN